MSKHSNDWTRDMSAEQLRERQRMLLKKFSDPNTPEAKAEKLLEELDTVEHRLENK